MKVSIGILLASLPAFIFLGFKIGIILLLIGLGLFAKAVGLFQRMDIIKTNIQEGIAYMEDYDGSYKKIGTKINKMIGILKKFKKKDYGIICFDHSNPLDQKTDLKHCKVSVGIYKKKGKNFKIDEEIDKYCKEQGMFFMNVPKTMCLHADWKYNNPLAMVYGIKKFYPKVHEQLNNPSYCKVMNVKKEDIKLAVEIYERSAKGKKTISFNIPFENQESFMIYGKKN